MLWYSLEAPQDAFNEYLQHMFSWRNVGKIFTCYPLFYRPTVTHLHAGGDTIHEVSDPIFWQEKRKEKSYQFVVN